MNSDSESVEGLFKIGLTGGIACGKTNVLRRFRDLGAHTIDADKLARLVVRPGLPAHQEIVDRFGPGILDSEGNIDRPRLGEIIFADEPARQDLNRIVHPRILEEEDRWIAECDPEKSRLVVVDAALMIEVGTFSRYDAVVVAFCPPAVQLCRLLRRDRLTREQALQRIDSQLSVYRKLTFADYVIDTSGEFSNTREQIDHVYRELIGRL
ncbi:MAG: dephospho-CoA kinase [Acidobacteriota bacterium]